MTAKQYWNLSEVKFLQKMQSMSPFNSREHKQAHNKLVALAKLHNVTIKDLEVY